VPPALVRIVARLLRKNPADRYPDATSLALDLETIADELEGTHEVESMSGATPDA
jgi:hypothetical protein